MQTKSVVVGITGGIGSGKTIVCKTFESFGAETYYADDRAKWLMQNDQALKRELIDLFGSSVLHNGTLDRKLISSKVFHNKHLLDKLNALVHPAVQKDVVKWEKERNTSNLLLKEAALLFETGSYKHLRKTILVTAPEELRLNRVLQRDTHRSPDEVKTIMQKQMSDEEKLPLADFIIVNDGSESVLAQVAAVHNELVVT